VSPEVGLKEIHDLILNSGQSGKTLSKEDIVETVTELKRTASYSDFNIEVLGSGPHWSVVWTTPHKYQTKFELLLFRIPDWPVYILSSDQEGFIEISPNGAILHRDFNW